MIGGGGGFRLVILDSDLRKPIFLTKRSQQRVILGFNKAKNKQEAGCLSITERGLGVENMLK